MESGNYRLAIPEPRLQIAAGVRTDLQLVREMLDHCVEIHDPIHDLCDELEEACWTTALVRYARCFSGRAWLADLVEPELNNEEFESHHYFRFIRDKMIGHAVAGLGEDFEVTAVVSLNLMGQHEIVAVGARPRRICSPGQNLAREFLALVVRVSAVVDAYYERERIRVLRFLRTKPMAEVVKDNPIVHVDLSLDKTNRQFRKYLDQARARRYQGP
ncbi:MAG TPA: hypothetical protein VIP30_14720 [Stenotrophomonas sp.]